MTRLQDMQRLMHKALNDEPMDCDEFQQYMSNIIYDFYQQRGHGYCDPAHPDILPHHMLLDAFMQYFKENCAS